VAVFAVALTDTQPKIRYKASTNIHPLLHSLKFFKTLRVFHAVPIAHCWCDALF